jgi:hypothetical protein
MLEEVLQSADAVKRSQDQEQQTATHLEQRGVVVDICAGDESLRPVTEKMGLRYVGIDVKPKEKPKAVKGMKRKTEEAALCLLHQGQVLCARRYVQVRQAQQWALAMSTRMLDEATLFDTAKRALTTQTGLRWGDAKDNLLHAPVSIVIGSTTVYVVEVERKYTKEQLTKAAFSRTSIVGAHVGIAQWRSLQEVEQGSCRQLEVHAVDKLYKRCLDQEKEGCKINNKDTVAQLRCVKNRKDAHGLEQDPNLIRDKQDDAKTKESRDTKQGRGKTTDRPGGEEMLQTSHKGKTSEMCVRNKRRTPDIQMQGNHGGGGPSERLAVLHEV